MIIDIIPTKKLPKSLSVLSYKVPKNLEGQVKIGQLATIPLRNSITTGVITDIHKSKRLPYPLKDIINLINPKPIFTQTQLKLFIQLAQYYHVSASLFVHFNLPKLIKKDWQKLKIEKVYPVKSSAKGRGLPEAEFNGAKPQTLVIVPRISDIERAAKQLKLSARGGSALGGKYTPIHRNLSRAENFNTYLKTTKQTTFIGTRSAIFYPYTNLKAIIIYDQHSPDHKQYDMNPRYETKIAAEILSKIIKAKIIYSSPNLPQHKINIVNLANELIKKNFSFISEKLYSQIKQTIKSKKTVFLFVNKKGQSSTTQCQDCQHVFSCPTCQLPLILSNDRFTPSHSEHRSDSGFTPSHSEHRSDSGFICYYCHHTEDVPPFCPKCTGPNFHSTGLGIQKVEDNLKKLFPKTKILSLDKDSKISNLKSEIILGTEFALDKIDWQKIGLLGIINADNLWHHTEFMAAETAYQLLIKLLTLADKDANIIIQTFNPEHYIIQSIQNNQPQIFHNQELKFRKKFDYPPYTNLIKLSYLNKSENKAKKQADKIYQKIKTEKNITVNPPMPILRKKIRGKYKYNIILKLKNLDDFNSKLIPHDWLIDIHPRILMD